MILLFHVGLSIILNNNRGMNIFLKEIQPASLCWSNSAFLMILMQYYLIILILKGIKPNLAPQGHHISSLWQDKFSTSVPFQKNLNMQQGAVPLILKNFQLASDGCQISIFNPNNRFHRHMGHCYPTYSSTKPVICSYLASETPSQSLSTPRGTENGGTYSNKFLSLCHHKW